MPIGREIAAGVSALILALGATSCGGQTAGSISQSLLVSLGLRSDPLAFDTVAGGAGFTPAIRVDGLNCGVVARNAYLPPGQTGEAAGGESDVVSYPELLQVSWSCGKTAGAERAFRLLNPQGTPVSGVADRAVVFNDSTRASSGFAGNRVFDVTWQQGSRIGLVDLVGPMSDGSLTANVAERLAHEAASG